MSLLLPLFNDIENVVLAHDEILGPIQRDLLTGVFAEEHGVTSLDIERGDRAIVPNLALTDGQDLALLGFLLRCVRMMMMPPTCCSVSSMRSTSSRS